MENFFNYITKPLKSEDVELLLRANNIIIEKVELFSDFCHTLNILIDETYLGDEDNFETNIKLTNDDKRNHFNWCWNKTIEFFKEEQINFIREGEHYDYFHSFFDEIFYSRNDFKLKKSTHGFYDELFDLDKPFTKSDLDMLINIYKLLDSNLEK
jgi:hypothetical protein